MQRAVVFKIGEVDVRFASAEDLIVHKIVAGRPRDLEDVRTVVLRNPGLDHQYVKHCLDEIGRTIDEPLLDRYERIVARA